MTVRHFELRDALSTARRVRAYLAVGNLAAAIRAHGLGLRTLYFQRGASAYKGWAGVDATATLAMVYARLGHWIADAVEAATRPVPRVEAEELVDDIAESLRILVTRDALDIDDELLVERARNVAAGLTYRFEFVRRSDVHERAPAQFTVNSQWLKPRSH